MIVPAKTRLFASESVQMRWMNSAIQSEVSQKEKANYRILMHIVFVAQLSLTLCDPMDCSPPGSSVHGILQARILEWLPFPSPGGSSPSRDGTQVSRIAGGFFTI